MSLTRDLKATKEQLLEMTKNFTVRDKDLLQAEMEKKELTKDLSQTREDLRKEISVNHKLNAETKC